MKLLILSLLTVVPLAAIAQLETGSQKPVAKPEAIGRLQVLPGVPSAGNLGACGRDTSYLDAHQTGGPRVWGPYPDGSHQDYWRFANPPAAVINRAIAEGFNVQYQHGNYIVTRTCR